MRQTKRILGKLSIKSDTACEGMCLSPVTVYNIPACSITVTHSSLVANIKSTSSYWGFFPSQISIALCNKVMRMLNLALSPVPTLSQPPAALTTQLYHCSKVRGKVKINQLPFSTLRSCSYVKVLLLLCPSHVFF